MILPLEMRQRYSQQKLPRTNCFAKQGTGNKSRPPVVLLWRISYFPVKPILLYLSGAPPCMKAFVACIFLWLGYRCCQGQDNPYSIVQYTTDNGLPQNSVKDIKFDKAGYCWLSTEMGLVRFDGKDFKTYGSNEISGLLSVRMDRMAKDPSGNLFMKTAADQIISISTSNRFISPIPKIINPALLRIAHGGYAIAGRGFIDAIETIAKQAPATHSIILYSLNDRQIYAKDEDKLYCLQKGRSDQVEVSVHHSAWESHIMAPIGNKHLLFFLPGNRINIWKDGVPGSNLTWIEGDLADNEAYRKFKFEDYKQFKFKLFWCENGTYVFCGNNIYQLFFEQGKVKSRKIIDNINIPGLACIYYAPSQNRYYLGSAINGLHVVQFNSFQYPAIPAQVARPNFYAQAKVDENTVFSNDALVTIHGKPSYVPLETNEMVAFYVNNKKQLFYERNYHLRKFDFRTNQDIELANLNSRLRAVFPEPSDSSIIFATRDSIGVLKGGKRLVYKQFPDKLKIVDVLRLEKNTFLLATEQGLKYYRFQVNKVYQSFLDSLHIRALFQESGDRLWISTYGKGFYLKQKNRLYKMPDGPKQALKTVHAFIEDRKGNFWLPTNDGLYVVKKADLIDYAGGKTAGVYFFMLNRLNGLRTNEFNGGCNPAYAWLKDSLLSLPSMDGLVWLYPNRLHIEYPLSDIRMDYLNINGKQVNLAGNSIVLPPKYGIMSIGVSCPYFGSKENIQLEYMISGITTQPLPVPPNGEVTLSGLSHGRYVVTIRKQGVRIGQGEQQIKVVITVTPPFYNTWWFYGFLAVLLSLVVYFIIRQRVKFLKRRSAELEGQIATRTAELSEAIEELGQSEQALLRSNQFKDKVVTMVLHDLRSPIRFISNISSMLLKNREMFSRQQLDETLFELDRGAKGLQLFTEQFFIWAATQQENFAVRKQPFPINDLFRELFELYHDITRLNNNTLIVDYPGLTVHTDYQILAFIVRNLIDNANKNTSSGSISLSAGLDVQYTLITVSDTGRGMSQQQIERFLDENKNVIGEGTGSILILEMLRKISGKLDIKSVPASGTIFTVRIENFQ